MGTHARHSSRSDCIDVKNQRIAALEAELAAERARVAELEADRERLDFVLEEMYVYHGGTITKREQIDAAREVKG